jgi:magnesium-protoporphyrin O-methyltransferase
MSSCCTPFSETSQRQFSAAVARSDLARYRRRGPDVTTRLLRDAILGAGGASTVLDVGAGIGMLSFELLAAGAEHATTVEAAPAYLSAAREEAARRNVAHRIETASGDFVTVAQTIGPADVVTMDRVVCCYPAYQPLLEAAVDRSRRLLALSYPRDRWFVRLVVALQNAVRAVFRNPFRTFVHSPRAMEALLERHGFARLQRRCTLVWAADLYGRAGAA